MKDVDHFFKSCQRRTMLRPLVASKLTDQNLEACAIWAYCAPGKEHHRVFCV